MMTSTNVRPERTPPAPWARRGSCYLLWRDLDGSFCRSILVRGAWRTYRSSTATYPDRYPSAVSS